MGIAVQWRPASAVVYRLCTDQSCPAGCVTPAVQGSKGQFAPKELIGKKPGTGANRVGR